MSFTIMRVTKVAHSISITNLNIEKLKKDLSDHGYLEEIQDFENEADLISILETDDNATSLVFHVLMNSSGYERPVEDFLDGETYKVV